MLEARVFRQQTGPFHTPDLVLAEVAAMRPVQAAREVQAGSPEHREPAAVQAQAAGAQEAQAPLAKR